MTNFQRIIHGTTKAVAGEVHAMLFSGDLISMRAIETFAKTGTHDTYACSTRTNGVMYVTTHMTLPIPGEPEVSRDVVLTPGVYLVRTSDGGYFTMPAPAFHEIYNTGWKEDNGDV